MKFPHFKIGQLIKSLFHFIDAKSLFSSSNSYKILYSFKLTLKNFTLN